MTPRLVVFDVDGTLVDSQRQILAAMAAAFAELGLPAPPREATLAIVGLSLPVALGRLAPELGHDGLGQLVAAYRRAFAAIRAGEAAPLYPGARAALERLAAEPGVRLALATGKSRRGLAQLLAAHGLEGLFDSVQVADDHPSKPDPAMLLAALEETGVPAAAAVMVGDTDYDIHMGRAAGVRTIGVTWGYHPPARLLAARADAMIEGFEALPGALARLWSAA